MNEKLMAKKYWKERSVKPFYLKEGKQSKIISNIVRDLIENGSYNISSVFEFGCNAGRNLFFLKKEFTYMKVYGIDLNPDAIELGMKKFNLSIDLGDETHLKRINSKSFDVVFTVSVLDHLPFIEDVLIELSRISKKFLIFLEPYCGESRKASKESIANFSYFWDYPNIFKKLEFNISLNEPSPLGERGLGPYYYLYIIKQKN